MLHFIHPNFLSRALLIPENGLKKSMNSIIAQKLLREEVTANLSKERGKLLLRGKNLSER